MPGLRPLCYILFNLAQDLERLLRQPEPEPVQAPAPKQEQQPEQHPEQAQAPPPPQAQPEQVQVGESIQARKRDPLKMIKRSAPLLSAAKSESIPRPLGPLTAAAGADETCVWNRVRSSSVSHDLMMGHHPEPLGEGLLPGWHDPHVACLLKQGRWQHCPFATRLPAA